MDKLEQKHLQLAQALETLNKSVTTFGIFVKEKKGYNPHMDYLEEYRMHRDSVIQRFEYSIDLFWKYIKKYLEDANALSGMKLPADVIRTAYSLELLSADDAETILQMIKDRNLTSHIYVEEIAEDLVADIPHYCQTLSKVLSRLAPSKQ
ncbi:MAG: Nucleotidyltransferase substrate binding protein, HI0074 family [candidate division TM6 bacterium GW2011_GWF2_37_49]|nr:MAG: Nucleotidyltransferase substrate binding protein, HI0074 family [candidate division TM6 bacterium GW2011_GWF2_37_49]